MSVEATPIKLPAASGIVPTSYEGEYLGFSMRETSGTIGATVVLYDSNTAPTTDTPILEEITLTANESAREHYGRSGPGRLVTTGIWAQITGSVEGSVFQ